MNPWPGPDAGRNPYVHNALRIARVPREVVRAAPLAQLIHETQQAVQAGAHHIGGVPVTPEQLNQAQQTLADAAGRLSAELLEHATEHVSIEGLRALDRELAGAEPDAVQGDELELWVRRCLHQFLEQASEIDPWFGAAELEIVPPYGRGHDGM